MDSDDQELNHQEEENEEEDDHHEPSDEENEGEGNSTTGEEVKPPKKEIDPRFIETLPEPKEEVDEVSIHLREREEEEEEGEEGGAKHTADHTKKTPLQKVSVRVILPAEVTSHHTFQRRYKKPLKEMERENVLRQLLDDVEGRRAYQQHCEEQDGEEKEEEEEEEDVVESYEEVNKLDNTNPPPPPFWLPSVLANDAVYVERTLAAMYGWAVPPPPVLKPNKKGQSVSFGEGKDHGGEEDDEEGEVDEDGVRVAPVKKRLSYFHQTNAFHDDEHADSRVEDGDEDGEEGEETHEEEEEGEEAGSHHRQERSPSDKQGEKKRAPSGARGSMKTVASATGAPHSVTPLYNIPNFPYWRYSLYLCYDRNAEEWVILTVHPRLYTAQVKKEAGNKGEEEDAGRAQEDDQEEENEEEDEDEEGGGGNKGGKSKQGAVIVPDYDYQTILLLDGLLLCILCCPSALRFCLLQKQAPRNSLRHLEEWLQRDFTAAFPYLSTLYTALLAARSKDEARLPYPLPTHQLDFNFFFTPQYVTGAGAASSDGNPISASKDGHAPVLIGGARKVSKERTSDVISVKQVEDLASPLTAEAYGNMQALLIAGIRPSQPPKLEYLTNNEAIRLALWLLMVTPAETVEEWGKQYKKRIAYLKEMRNDREEGGERGEEDEEEEEDPLSESGIMEFLEQEKEKEAKKKEKQYMTEPALFPSPFLLATIHEIRRRLLRELAGKPPSKQTMAMCLHEHVNEAHLEDGGVWDPLVTKTFYLQSPSAPVRHQKLYQSELVLLLFALLTTPRDEVKMSVAPKTEEEEIIAELAQSRRETLYESGREQDAGSQRKEKVTTVSKRRRTTHAKGTASDLDAHSVCFSDLLEMKMNKHVTPLDKIRSGMLRLLYLNLPRFQLPSTVVTLCEATPLYEMLGLNESCPLPDLVNSWSREITLSKTLDSSTISSTSSFLNTFVNYFWDEIHTRVQEKLYDKATLQSISIGLPSLMEKVRERQGQFVGVLDLLSRRVKVVIPRHKNIPQGVDEGSKRLSVSLDPSGRKVRTLSLSVSVGQEQRPNEPTLSFGVDSNNHITVTNPSPYSEEYRQEENRVRAIFESLPVAPKSIFSPKTLHHLLFEKSDIDVVTVKYLLKQPTVNGYVCANPLRDSAVPALQYALEQSNFPIAKLVVGLGASLEDLTEEGTTVLRCLAEEVFSVDEVEELLEIDHYNKEAIAGDPTLGFGLYRTLAANEAEMAL